LATNDLEGDVQGHTRSLAAQWRCQ